MKQHLFKTSAFYRVAMLERPPPVQLMILEKAVERGIIVQDIGFTVLSKNFSFAYTDVGKGHKQERKLHP